MMYTRCNGFRIRIISPEKSFTNAANYMVDTKWGPIMCSTLAEAVDHAQRQPVDHRTDNLPRFH